MALQQVNDLSWGFMLSYLLNFNKCNKKILLKWFFLIIFLGVPRVRRGGERAGTSAIFFWCRLVPKDETTPKRISLHSSLKVRTGEALPNVWKTVDIVTENKSTFLK
jgi:hypothetical protein